MLVCMNDSQTINTIHLSNDHQRLSTIHQMYTIDALACIGRCTCNGLSCLSAKTRLSKALNLTVGDKEAYYSMCVSQALHDH